MFEVSTAKREVLQKLADQAWTPTDLAEELDKSRNTAYNHLEDLHRQGVLTKNQVPAKTRPKTEYSIGDGFIQYLAVLPGQYTERSLELTPDRQAVLRVWSVPQETFHPYIERYWWRLKTSPDINYRDEINAVALYGSVARGDADTDSDIDFLVLTDDNDTEAIVSQHFGSTRIETQGGSKICMTEVHSIHDYRTSLAQGSGFLETIQEDLHIIYDPDNVLQPPRTVVANE